MRSAVLSVTELSTLRRMVTETRAGRAVAHRFIAGDTLGEAVAVAKQMNAAGMVVSLDHLGEHVQTIEDADAATASYMACLDAIEDAGIAGNISVKLTQLGMGLDDEAAAANLDILARAAERTGTTVTVDMEESAHTTRTIDMYLATQQRHGNLGIAIQSYLRRTVADLDRIVPHGGLVRLCKGAYAEHEDIAFTARKEVDESFDRLASILMHAPGVVPAIATHDDARIDPVLDLAEMRTEPWEFQMLYGIRRDRQAQLVAAGHAVRVYVPYGVAWYPYFTRRLAERPANVTFFARALLGS